MDEVSAALTGAWIAAILRSATPLLLVLLGETLTQRVGIINLGVEGQMLAGACFGFAAAATFGDPWLALLAGALAGAVLSLVHAALCLGFKANQIASGISVMILGIGVPSDFGRTFVGSQVSAFAPLAGNDYAGLYLIGPILHQLTPVAPLALLLAILAGIWLYRTRSGLIWRAVGESPALALAFGYHPIRIKLQGIVIGGVLSGIAGAVLSVDYTQTWAQEITKGRGLIAVGLVIVARWNPFLVIPVALLFGAAEAAVLRLQAAAFEISSYLLACLPYVLCLAVLILTHLTAARDNVMPAALKSVFGGSR
jgi:simple sugar transport system permease protein